jgi:hypothetical protein
MTTKPILFWPKPRSDIALYLDREADDFLVVDTDDPYELQKLYKLRREIPIFDPYPGYGEHYRDFSDHVVASNCRYHIVGLNACQELLQAMKDPSLAHSSIEELLAATKLACNAPSSTIMKRSQKVSIDWSYLNLANISVSAIFVFVATLIGNVLSLNNSLIAAIVATLHCTFAHARTFQSYYPPCGDVWPHDLSRCPLLAHSRHARRPGMSAFGIKRTSLPTPACYKFALTAS